MANRTANSETLFNRARQVIPGGVNSPVRAAKAVGAVPLFYHPSRRLADL